MASQISVSIIIPCKYLDDYTEECVRNCLDLNYQHFEILVLPDSEQKLFFSDSRVKVIPTGGIKPAEKRNIGIKYSNGKICAFIDADAFPDKDWLRNAVKYLQNPEVVAVGGPGVTPSKDNERQQASGLILSSWLGAGGLCYRYVSRRLKKDEDLPTCNLILRASVLNELGGFNVNYWPGEDTYLSLQITKQLNMKMVYAPDVIVYHHRRHLFKPHLKQIWNYGLHRGYFVKRFPKTSRKPLFFMPSMFILGLMGGIVLSLLNPLFKIPFVGTLAIYLVASFAEGLKTRSVKMAFLVSTGIILTHITYGIAFLKGLMTGTLEE